MNNIINYISIANTLFMNPHLSNFVKMDIPVIFTEKEITLLLKVDGEFIEPDHTYYFGADDMDDSIVCL